MFSTPDALPWNLKVHFTKFPEDQVRHLIISCTRSSTSRFDAGCLAPETRRLILARLGQDYACFGYDPGYLVEPEAKDPRYCAALSW